MTNRLQEFEELLKQLESNRYSKVIIAPEPDLDWASLEMFDLNIKGSSEGVHYFGSVRIPAVDMIGPKEDFRKLGLLLIMRGLTHPKEDIFMRLVSHDKSPVNAIMFNGLARPPDVFDLVPNGVIYYSADISASYPRNDACEACESLPGFGIIDDSISVRTDFNIPNWVNYSITFNNSANGCLRLGKLLLDFSHPSNGIDELHLEPANRAVSQVSYEARFWLPGSFGDDDAYR